MKIKISIFLFVLFIFNALFYPIISNAETNPPNIYSPAAILMDYNTGKILYEKNINEKKYPASLTKVMTAIIVLENCNLTDIATVSYDAIMSIPPGYVTANIQVGEELTVEQLLYILIVGSSNDAAIVLAEHVSGSVQEFCNLMNQKAKEIGCTSTNFVNPNGEHDENHYSTAYDLAIITRYAMKNDFFRTLCSTTSYTLPITNKYDKKDRIFTNTNSLLHINNDYYYKYATGVKTGFTTPAANCLIASSNKDNLELISVVLGAVQTDDGLSQRYLDTISLFNYGYENYTLREVAKKGSIVQTINVKNASLDTKKLDLAVANDIYALTKAENKNSSLLPEVKINDDVKAPLKEGDIVGTVKYTVEGVEYTENLLASHDVKSSNIFIVVFLLLFLIFLYWLLFKSKRKNKKNRRIR